VKYKTSQLPFELLYLALLTQDGVKPLSRWEGCFGNEEIDMLRTMGLRIRIVTRRTLLKTENKELIFSKKNRLLGKYRKIFDGKSLSIPPSLVRLEGAFFGYPECCVEEFIKNPYATNTVTPTDQRILFHQACRDCEKTPLFLPSYRSAHNRTNDILAGLEPLPLATISPCRFRRPATRGLLTAASLVILASGCHSPSGTSNNGMVDPDVHWLPVEEDGDNDGLNDTLEHYFEHVEPCRIDTDGNGIPDGRQLAQEMHFQVVNLGTEEIDTGPFRRDFYAYGMICCPACGEMVNMGYCEVVNFRRGLCITIPYLALHYIAHGSFIYEQNAREDRISPVELSRALEW
jgi:hypothetical protein